MKQRVWKRKLTEEHFEDVCMGNHCPIVRYEHNPSLQAGCFLCAELFKHFIRRLNLDSFTEHGMCEGRRGLVRVDDTKFMKKGGGKQ